MDGCPCLIFIFFVLNRYPYDEAATVAISTVKEFGSDLKEVLSAYNFGCSELDCQYRSHIC